MPFYQKNWEMVGPDVTKLILGVLNDGALFPNCNETNVALLPKKKNSQVPADYQQISMCNILYKLISKTLVNRLKESLPDMSKAYDCVEWLYFQFEGIIREIGFSN